VRKESLTERHSGRQISPGHESWRPLARHLAKRFAASGACDEALTEVAMATMAEAESGFDSEPAEFASVVVPLVIRALRRYRREQLRNRPMSAYPLPPRLAMVAAEDELSRWLQRSPTVAEVARHMGATQDDVVAALDAGWRAGAGSAEGC
jgi:RNA polymerase sigma-B factor